MLLLCNIGLVGYVFNIEVYFIDIGVIYCCLFLKFIYIFENLRIRRMFFIGIKVDFEILDNNDDDDDSS